MLAAWLGHGTAGKSKLRMAWRRPGRAILPVGMALALSATIPATFAQGTTAPNAGTPNSGVQNASTQPAHLSKPPQPAHHAKAKEPAPLELPPPAPAVAPNLFDQPALPATITSGNNQLTVQANNSSLSQILHQVSSKTGMQLDGLGGDERVFGSFGPGAPREVLTALLNGTSYNVVMVGNLPNGAPRELMLVRKSGGRSTQPLNQAQNPGNPNPGQSPDQAGQNGDEAPPDDSGNSDDSSDDSAPPMQYTPPSIAPASPTDAPNAQSEGTTNPNPRVTAPMPNAPQ